MTTPAFFPKPVDVKDYEGVSSACYELGDESRTFIMVSRLRPGAAIPVHAHAKAQFGLALNGSFSLEANGRSIRLPSLEKAYYLPPDVPHSAVNDSDVEALTVDIKRLKFPDHEPTRGLQIMELTPPRTIKSGIVLRFFVAPWFEVMVSKLPPGALMPVHSHSNEQIGIGVSGHYTLQVGDSKTEFARGSVYYAPGGVPHGGWNDNTEEALSLNIFIPPRYNKPSRRAPGKDAHAGQIS